MIFYFVICDFFLLYKDKKQSSYYSRYAQKLAASGADGHCI